MKHTARSAPKAARIPYSGERVRRVRRPFRKTRLFARLVVALFVLGCIWIGYVLWLTGSYRSPAALPKADAGIVLGAALWRDKPSPGLRERLDHALRLYRQGAFPTFIVSGGLDYNGSTLTEAEGMRDYLVAAGVPASRILLEERARSTYENLLFSHAIMKQRGLRDAIVITHTYHAPRSLQVARYVGIPGAVVSAVESDVLNMPYNRWREVLAFTKWKLDEHLLRLGIRPAQ